MDPCILGSASGEAGSGFASLASACDVEGPLERQISSRPGVGTRSSPHGRSGTTGDPCFLWTYFILGLRNRRALP